MMQNFEAKGEFKPSHWDSFNDFELGINNPISFFKVSIELSSKYRKNRLMINTMQGKCSFG